MVSSSTFTLLIFSSESEESETEEEQEEGVEDDVSSKALQEGLVTPSGLSSVPSGLETPDYIELRKYQSGPTGAATANVPPSLASGLETPEVIELRKYQRYELRLR
jgi:hypothetical protein